MTWRLPSLVSRRPSEVRKVPLTRLRIRSLQAAGRKAAAVKAGRDYERILEELGVVRYSVGALREERPLGSAPVHQPLKPLAARVHPLVQLCRHRSVLTRIQSPEQRGAAERAGTDVEKRS